MAVTGFAAVAAIIVALINLIIAIIALIRLIIEKKSAKTQPERPRSPATRWKLMFWISSFIFVLSIVVILRPPWDASEIKITNIAEGDSVVVDVMVKGTSKNIPNDQKIWLVVYSHPVKRFYPQDNPADMQVNGNWSSRCYVGIDEDVGERFDLIAILAGNDVQRLFNEYVKEAEAEEAWLGLEAIPDCAEVHQRITVFRK